MKRAVFGALIASTALLLTGCIGPFAPIGGLDKSIDLIFEVDFSQSQAVPDFDTSEYVMDDYDDIAAFQQLLRDHEIEPWTYRTTDSGLCTGGVSTTLSIMYRENPSDTILIDGCGADDGSFEADVTTFFSDYREAHAQAAPLPNDDIVALTFTQSQALPDFDTSEHTQDHAQQVARFTDLLSDEGIVWSEGVDPSLLGEPCPGSITTAITAHYAGTDLVVGPVEIGGCSDNAWVDEVTALFAEWREAT